VSGSGWCGSDTETCQVAGCAQVGLGELRSRSLAAVLGERSLAASRVEFNTNVQQHMREFLELTKLKDKDKNLARIRIIVAGDNAQVYARCGLIRTFEFR
jgi:hypothetical protein